MIANRYSDVDHGARHWGVEPAGGEFGARDLEAGHDGEVDCAAGGLHVDSVASAGDACC